MGQKARRPNTCTENLLQLKGQAAETRVRRFPALLLCYLIRPSGRSAGQMPPNAGALWKVPCTEHVRCLLMTFPWGLRGMKLPASVPGAQQVLKAYLLHFSFLRESTFGCIVVLISWITRRFCTKTRGPSLYNGFLTFGGALV